MQLTDVELGMRDEHSVWEQLAEPVLRPPVHNAVNDLVKVRSRVDVVGDACGNDREDCGGALPAVVAPREEPIPSIMASSP